MSCGYCGQARQATANALRAAVTGNAREAASQSRQAAQAVAAKVRDESTRVRGILTRSR